MKKIRFILVAILALALLLGSIYLVFARSGCCSHHGGVCGCACCDGTPLSSKCAPYYPQCNKPQVKYQPAPVAPVVPIEPIDEPQIPIEVPKYVEEDYEEEVDDVISDEYFEDDVEPTYFDVEEDEASEEGGAGALLGLALLGGGSALGYWLIKRQKRG